MSAHPLRPRRRNFAALLVFCASFVPAASAQDGLERLPEESWSVIRIGGQPAGFSHTVRALVELDGQRLVHSREETSMKMGRLGTTLTVESVSESWETPTGAPVRLLSTSKVSSTETIQDLTFSEGKVAIATTTAGRTRSKERECPPGTLLSWGLSEAMRERIRAGEPSFQLRTWSTDLDKAAELRVERRGTEVVAIGGESRELLKIDTTVEGLPMVTSSWVDDAGEELRTLLVVAGIEIASEASDKESALRAWETSGESGPEVFTSSLVVEPAFLPAPRRAERAVLEIRARVGENGEPVELELLEDERQRFLGRAADGAQVFELRCLTPPPSLRGQRPLRVEDLAPELRSSLEANDMIQCDAEEIVRMAQEVVGEIRDPWVAAQRLEKHVEEFISEKNFGVGFASALEVCQNREGDCSEHAVLLTALCRAAGIPSRVAMGLLYIGGVWGGHAWSEVWIDGRWYALDATLGLGRCDALHLAFSKMTLEDGSLADQFAGLLQNMGNLDLKVVDLALARWVEPEAQVGRVQDGWYVDDAWGLRFEVPPGFEARVARPEPSIEFEILDLDGDRSVGRLRLQVRGYDAGPGGSWPAYLGDLAEGVPFELDGRPALRFDERRIQRVLVRAGAKVFLFKFSRVGADARPFLEALLETVDFDF